jgi:peptide chain release factor subunit 1
MRRPTNGSAWLGEAEMDDGARLILLERLRALKAATGSATEMVSLYIPPDRAVSDVVGRLRGELSQAQNIKNRTNRQGVTSAIGTLAIRVSMFSTGGIPTNGLAAFAGPDITSVFEPPEPISSYFYRCGDGFMLQPLEDMLATSELFGLVVLDRKEATIGWLKGSRIIEVFSTESHIMGKHQAGGQSANRYARQIEEETRKFYDRIGEAMRGVFLIPATAGDLKGILLGGPGATKSEWLKSVELDYRIRALIVPQLLETGYTNTQGLREMVSHATPWLGNRALEKERTVLAEFMEAARTDKAVYGGARVLAALQEGRLSKLLIDERRADAAILRDKACRVGTQVVLIEGRSDDAASFCAGFGGLGGILRWS